MTHKSFLARGAALPLLVFIIGFIFILLISVFSGWILWWAGAACLGVLFLKKFEKPLPITPLSVSFFIFMLVLFFNGVVFNNVYHGEILFYILFFTLPFIIFSRLDSPAVERFFKTGAFIFALLVSWGLVQHLTESLYIVDQGGRANAIFYTSNTFATGINLFLLPFVALYLLGIKLRLTYMLSLFFFSGLMATQSRGGYLGLIFGLLFLAIFNLIGQGNLKLSPNRWVRLAMGFVVVILIFQFSPSWSGEDVKAMVVEGDTSDRLVLYGIAWNAIKVNPIWGYGYFNFGYIFQRYKMPPFTDKTALFVHSDYLQTWLETGLPGLLALLALISVFYLSIWRKRSDLHSLQSPAWLPAAGAAMTSIFVHAAVDFPLYVPTMQLLSGAYMGAVAGILKNHSIPNPGLTPSLIPALERIGIRLKTIKVMAISVLLLWLIQPAIAQFAVNEGLEYLSKGNVNYALKKYRLAQRLVPGNAYYYWCEGIILKEQAIELRNRELAMLTDNTFAKGAGANPYFRDNLIERIRFNRDHRALLENPVSPETLLEWAEHVRSWNPHLPSVKAEYARSLAFAGKRQEALKAAKDLQRKHPDSKLIQNLARDLGINSASR